MALNIPIWKKCAADSEMTPFQKNKWKHVLQNAIIQQTCYKPRNDAKSKTCKSWKLIKQKIAAYPANTTIIL